MHNCIFHNFYFAEEVFRSYIKTHLFHVTSKTFDLFHSTRQIHLYITPQKMNPLPPPGPPGGNGKRPVEGNPPIGPRVKVRINNNLGTMALPSNYNPNAQPLPPPYPQAQDSGPSTPDNQAQAGNDNPPDPRVRYIVDKIEENRNQKMIVGLALDNELREEGRMGGIPRYKKWNSRDRWMNMRLKRPLKPPESQALGSYDRKDRFTQRGRFPKENNAVRFRMTRQQRDLWLGSQDTWDQLLSDHEWRGVKVFGQGSFGIVGLWERDDLEEGDVDWNEEVGIDERVNRVVVKQSMDMENNEMLVKEERMQAILSLYSQHICRCFSTSAFDLDEEEEKNEEELASSGLMDPRNKRIFLEYCEGGDGKSLMNKILRYGLAYSTSFPMFSF